jgi:hypothetical protein
MQGFKSIDLRDHPPPHQAVERVPVAGRHAAHDVQTRTVCRKEMETITRLRLLDQGDDRSKVQRRCGGDRTRSGRRLMKMPNTTFNHNSIV